MAISMFGDPNSLVVADCLDYLQNCIKEGKTEFIDLIYIDPPFNSNRDYNIIIGNSDLTEEAFKDTWSNITYLDLTDSTENLSVHLYSYLKYLEESNLPKSYIGYLTNMSIRCFYMRELLKDTGSFYFHCDPTASHYIKSMLDIVFGINNFRNEIVWERGGSGGSWKVGCNYFGKNHDIIFWYSKTDNYYFNKEIIPWSEEKIKLRFNKDDNDGKGRYYWNTYCHGPSKKLDKMLESGQAKKSENSETKIPYYYKCYALESNCGSPVGDLWNDIQFPPNSNERLGYPTQKPEALLERIIKSSSKSGDLVADFYLGGGTTIATSERLGRRFIGVDINLRSIEKTNERLKKLGKLIKVDYTIYGIPRSAKELRKMVDDNILGKDKDSRFTFEDIIIKYYLKGVTGNIKQRGDDSIDGRFMFEFQGKKSMGIVQVTTSGNKDHLKKSCAEMGKGKYDMVVYVTFEDTVNDYLIREAKLYRKIGTVDKVQILTVEDLIDRGKQYEIPKDILTF